MSALSCPLCSLALSAGSLEGHLREELLYAAVRCTLCRLDFTDAAAAEEHFVGPTAAHPAQPARLLRLAKEPEKEARLLELLRLARGGPDAVQERLCVCGRCRLLCREAGGDGERPEASRWEQDESRLPARDYDAPQDERQAEFREAERSGLAEADRSVWPGEESGSRRYDGQDYDEAQAQTETKPELRDFKPDLEADGKVACVLCGLRVVKNEFKRHALMRHTETRPFACALCAWSEKTKGELAKHQKRDHEVSLSPESFTFVGSEAEMEELLEQCFGSAKDSADYVRVRCRPCDRVLNRSAVTNHVAAVHLRKALHLCRLCDYTSTGTVTTSIKYHVKATHQRSPGPHSIDSSRAKRYAPVIKGMVKQLFVRQ